ncbi:MAG: hypothetical protein HC771_17470 [Synechococcales cyanobacterium CRU_2_2]|nr:hypothetical protein [Synechococcales cyanobacterium CRU_2_2]
MLILRLYHRLNKRSRDAIHRTQGRRGRLYSYQPRLVLLQRLAEETNLPISEVENMLHDERAQILANPGAPIYQDFSQL